MASQAADKDLSLADQGRGRRLWVLQVQRLLLVCLALLCVLGSTYTAIGNAQEVLGPCDPSRPAVEPAPGHAHRLHVWQTPPQKHPQGLCEGVAGPFELPADLTDRDPYSDRPAHLLSSREAPDASTISNLPHHA